jgi:hypothetical protein
LRFVGWDRVVTGRERLESAGHVEDSEGGGKPAGVIGLLHHFAEDVAGAVEEALISIDGGSVKLNAIAREDDAVAGVEGFPSPEGFAIDLEALCDASIGEALNSQLDRSELDFGEGIDL